MTSVGNDQTFEQALDEASMAFLYSVANASADSKRRMLESFIAAVRLRDGIVGNYVKVQVFREVVDAVLERSLGSFADELKARIYENISPQMAETIEQELARSLRKVYAAIEDLIATTH